jgi:hypothetical protein
MRSVFPDARLILYFWDSVNNLPGSSSISPLFDAILTFDYRDSIERGWAYFPLFAGNHILPTTPCTGFLVNPLPIYDWSFVGAIHSDRILVLDKLCRSSLSKRRFYIFLYAPTIIHVFFYLIQHPLAFMRMKNFIHLYTLDSQLLCKIYSDSYCVLDIHHPCQTGVTMRTLEALLSGKKVATTNANAINLSIFDSSRICVIDRANPAIPIDFISSSVTPISPSLSCGYYPVDWLLRLLSN